jgi:hypothetical protein
MQPSPRHDMSTSVLTVAVYFAEKSVKDERVPMGADAPMALSTFFPNAALRCLHVRG